MISCVILVNLLCGFWRNTVLVLGVCVCTVGVFHGRGTCLGVVLDGFRDLILDVLCRLMVFV